MKNIVIVGDSFCSSTAGWPGILAARLNLNLICSGTPGGSWWPMREFLINLTDKQIDNTDLFIVLHTNTYRLPVLSNIGSYDLENLNENIEVELAIKLYYKYIYDDKFLHWAQDRWFVELNDLLVNKKIIHLHSFPWTVENNNISKGVNVKTNLASLSLNEIGATEFRLSGDNRLNHFSDRNNEEIALQLTNIIKLPDGDTTFDTTKFELQTTTWFNWK